ncbi:MAG TPA: excinuclease ABC subunit UvrA [Candidatus Babeliales bacterium]|nr:excinuclease ABC subunit UvrA [Candidatus Babeliales bacterium]
MIRNIVCPLRCGLSTTRDITKIIVHGAKEHNLKNICFEIPKGKLVALTGPSGSGKSSIATDILQKECIRQYLESLGMTTDHIEKAKVDILMGLSPSIGVSQRVTDFNPRSTVGTKTGILTILRNMFAAMGYQPCTSCERVVKQPLQDKNKLVTIEIEEKTDSSKKRKKSYFNCPHCNTKLEKLTMAHFSSNTIVGACEACKGLGEVISVDLSCLLNEERSIRNGGVNFWDEALAKYYEGVILAASKHYNFLFDAETPMQNYTQEQRNFLLYGISFPDFVKAYKHTKAPKKVSEGLFEGVVPGLLNLYKNNPAKASDNIKKYIVNEPCAECEATGLARIGKKVTIFGKTIVDVIRLNLSEFLQWLCDLNESISEDELQVFAAFADALQKRTSNLIEVGLHYVSLNRTLPSLSAGESQRVRLASLLGSELTGVLYVVDEPTTGLHPHDTAKLLKTLRMIQEAGNTVLVIEHDVDVIKNADFIIDMGPGGGSQGGEVIVSGTPADVMACERSITGKYLAKKPFVDLNTVARQNKEKLVVHGANEHNLKNIDVIIPLKQLVVLTGVSGSGKSTFLFDIVDKAARQYFNNASTVPGKYTSIDGLDYFDRIVNVDQVTIGSRSSRSNVATYTKLFDYIRDVFASLPEAKIRGFNAKDFSFNVSEKRCENCDGAGVVEVDMTFMPNIEEECPVCNGTRFNEKLLEVKFQGYNIANILDMTVNDAIAAFRDEKKIFAILDLMRQVDLGHLKLGQSTATLSGGEAQRIKLAAELSKSEAGNTLYLLDEPTTGLHPHEVGKLLTVFRKLISKGNTVVVIEHNLDVACEADTIIDFGPGGGIAGGTIVATGTPQEIIENRDSLTGQSLKDYITGNGLNNS